MPYTPSSSAPSAAAASDSSRSSFWRRLIAGVRGACAYALLAPAIVLWCALWLVAKACHAPLHFAHINDRKEKP